MPTPPAADRWEAPTVAEEPDYVTTAALTRELRGLRLEVKRQGEAVSALAVAVEHLVSELRASRAKGRDR